MTITELHTYRYACEGGDRDDTGQWRACKASVTRQCTLAGQYTLPEGWAWGPEDLDAYGYDRSRLLCPFHAQQVAREDARP